MISRMLAGPLALLLASGCEVTVNGDGNQNNEADPAAAEVNRERPANAAEAAANRERDAARRQLQDLRFVVDKSERKVTVFQGDKKIRTHEVAVGTEKNPTPSGKWEFTRVDLNPEWIPPDSKWAEERERKPPGDPENPMGRARLVFNMPYTIHGTDASNSLGKAVSHGSIRISNDVVLQLAEMLLRAGGSWQGRAWFDRMAQNRTKEFQIPLEDPVPIEVKD